MSKFQILHISDLHIKKKEEFDRSVVLDPLLERIEKDLANDLRPEIIVVTGDIAYSGVKEEYDLAKDFFDKLLTAVNLSPEKLFIVPGNHDVNRKRYRKSDVPRYETMRELNDELENEEYRADLLKGMDEYFKFIEENYPHLTSKHSRLVPFVISFPAKCGKKIGLIGLNSAWMCRKSPDEKEIAIGHYQIKKAQEELKSKGDHKLVINIMHHPIDWLWVADKKICKSYFDRTIVLAGHIHDAECTCGEHLVGDICNFYAGASYTGSDSPAYNSYQYINVDTDENSITLNFKKFDLLQKLWVLEGEKGDDGTKDFNIPWVGVKETIRSIDHPDIPASYREWVIDRCQNMDIEKLAEKESVIKVSLPEIFIPLYSNPPTGKRENDPAKIKKRNVESAVDDEQIIKPISNIEDLVVNNDYLLIEGDPGSGKTTFLKYLAYSLAKEIVLKGLEDFLPVLIYLKDLKAFFDGEEGLPESRLTAERILSHFCADKGLDLETILHFCKAKKALFLLDGLDELSPDYRKIVVNSFKDFGIHHKGNKFVLSGRPHGIDTTVIDRFGEWHIKILTLNMEQVELFITNWFEYVYQEGSKVGDKTAEQMINEIKGHPGVSQLIETPLMLTAICILYHDGKELPEQRSELYRKFVNNLLYRRFREPERVYNFLKMLAFTMHSKNEKGIDKNDAVEVLGQVYAGSDRRPEDYAPLFESIEPDCGLLKLEDGQYTFRHLTFQEFLAAAYIVDKETDYSKAIKDYWYKDWYKEVVELYIGLLSLDNKAWTNKIVEDALKKQDKKPYKRWRLACHCILDIHKERRESKVIDLAKKRLLSIIASTAEPPDRADAGETLGWIGDTRNLQEFIRIEDGEYYVKSLKKKIILILFEIGKYPVTNSWFELFWKDDGYKKTEYWSDEGEKWLGKHKVTQPDYWDERRWRCPNSPVVGVSWFEADAFTKWLTSKDKEGFEYSLPDELEWEAVAAGLEGREFPWGNKGEENRSNVWDSKIRKTSPLGIFKQGDTPSGVSDLSGNVWEWTDSWYDKDKVTKVLRGGSWSYNARYARCANRDGYFPSSRDSSIGCRCARTLNK